MKKLFKIAGIALLSLIGLLLTIFLLARFVFREQAIDYLTGLEKQQRVELLRAAGPYAADTVTSPTFAIVNQYKSEGNRRIHHFDFYRINDLREAFDFGYEEYFYSGDLCLVEWPEKIEQLLPDNTMTVRITVDSDTARTFEID